MIQQVRVLSCNQDGTAQVVHVRESACSGDCHKCSGCGAAKETMQLTAVNQIGAHPGDWVILSSETRPVLLAACVLYVLPLVLFFAGYLAGMLLLDKGAITGCAAFLLGIVGAVIYDRRVAGKKKILYTITGYGEVTPDSREKEERDLD